MTTPNIPRGTDPADLPQGVIAPGDLGTALQDQSQGKFTNLAASKFPDIAKNTSAGNPSSVGGPLGFVVNKFSQITSNVANADPATITKPDDIVAKAGGFFGGLPLLSLIGDIAQAITGAIGGGLSTIGAFFGDLVGGALQGSNPFSVFSAIQGVFFHQAAVANSASMAATQAQGALNAAQAADRKVNTLLQGGSRTVYTSNTTWTPPTGLVKVGVLLYGGGRKGSGAAYLSPGGIGGGVVYAEFPASAFTGPVSITIGAGSSAPGVSSATSFGSYLSSTIEGGGQLQNSTLVALAQAIIPGTGGNSSNTDASGGTAGGSTALAVGGAAGTSSSTQGGAGGNAAVTGQYLAGGAGGGGGYARAITFGAAGNGGAGGFPGGGGGGAGRNNNETYWVGGAGAQGLCAIIEFTQATS